MPGQPCHVPTECFVVGTIETRSSLRLSPRSIELGQVTMMEQVDEVGERGVAVVFRAFAHELGVVQRQRSVGSEQAQPEQTHHRHRGLVAPPRRRSLPFRQDELRNFARRENQRRRLPEPERFLSRSARQTDARCARVRRAEAAHQRDEAACPGRLPEADQKLAHQTMPRPPMRAGQRATVPRWIDSSVVCVKTLMLTWRAR